ncbi:protein MSP1-like [Harpegnathos saltator]|uniref:protein MSP1-like n=1 Tax=Harpegnathos saltator TaxID=610380 RepID=UPI000DBECFC8|nr:protein MSP1-like [Harpegnathos saltator]
MGASTTVRVLVIIAIIVALIVALIYLVGRAKVRSNDRLKQLFNSETLDTLRIGVGVTAEEIISAQRCRARRRLDDARNTGDSADADADPHVHTDGLYEFIPHESLNVSLSDLPGYEEQHALLLNAYFVINDEPESVLLADEMMERRPSTRAGANVILYRPSGTGKTAAARAVARSLGSNLAFVNAENLLSTYRLETKKKLRSLYRKMRALVRTTGRNVLLLLDEVDGLVKNRSGAVTSGEYSLLTRFLTILEPNDGTDNYGVFSIFTTNRLSNLDDAFRRRCAAVFMGYVGYVGTREATVRLFNAFLHRPIDYATRGTRFASRD